MIYYKLRTNIITVIDTRGIRNNIPNYYARLQISYNALCKSYCHPKKQN